VNWVGWHFVHSKLRGADLRGAELGAAVFRDVDLRGAVLRNAVAGAMTTHGASFAGSDLTDINFRCADLFDADFSKAKLAGASLNGANLTSTRGLDTVDLDEVDMRLALYAAATPFPAGFDPRKRGAVLVGPKADLSGMVLYNRDLQDLKLEDANLTDMDLRGSDLSGADLTSADLRGSDLTGAELGQGARCTRFHDTILPDGTRWTGCGGDLPLEKRTPPPVRRAPRPMPPRTPTKREPLPCDGPQPENVDAGAGPHLALLDLLERYASGARDFSGLQIDRDASRPI